MNEWPWQNINALHSNVAEVALDMIILFVIASGRAVGFVFIHPVFGKFGINFGLLRGAVVIAMTIPIFPATATIIAANPQFMQFHFIYLSLIREIFIGVLLGLITGIPFWATIAAGEFLDIQRNASSATQSDSTGEQTAISGQLFFLIAVFVLTSEGFIIPAIFGSILDSYQVIPLFGDSSWGGSQKGQLVLNLLDDLFTVGITLAMPVLIPLLLTEMVVGVSTKYMPQINPTFLALSMKQVVYLVMLSLFLPFLVRYVDVLLGEENFTAEALRNFFDGAVR